MEYYRSDFDKKKKKKQKFNKPDPSEMISDDEKEPTVSEDEDDLKVKQLEETYSKGRLSKIMEKTEKVLEENEKEESQKKVKLKLPIKGEDGTIKKQLQVIQEKEEKKKVLTKQAKKDKKEQQKRNEEQEEDDMEDEIDEEEVFDSLNTKIEEETDETKKEREAKKQEKIRLQQILEDPILRENRRQKLRTEIGALASSILELPDVNVSIVDHY